MKRGRSSKNKTLLSFPPRPPEPVDAEDLRRSSRRLLELEAIRVTIEQEQREVARNWARWRKLMNNAKSSRNELLERLARGAQLAG